MLLQTRRRNILRWQLRAAHFPLGVSTVQPRGLSNASVCSPFSTTCSMTVNADHSQTPNIPIEEKNQGEPKQEAYARIVAYLPSARTVSGLASIYSSYTYLLPCTSFHPFYYLLVPSRGYSGTPQAAAALPRFPTGTTAAAAAVLSYFPTGTTAATVPP